MRYWLELHNDDTFELNTIGDNDTVIRGRLEDAGIEGEDPEFSNKLDDYFAAEFGIAPEDWEIG